GQLGLAELDQGFFTAIGHGAAEHHEVEQGVGAEAVGTVHRDAAGFAHRVQARYHRVGVAGARLHHFAVAVGGNAAHVVVGRGQHRDRLLLHVHAGEDARAFRDAGQALVDDLRPQVGEVEQDV